MYDLLDYLACALVCVHLNFMEHGHSQGKFAVNLGAVSLKRCAPFFTK